MKPIDPEDQDIDMDLANLERRLRNATPRPPNLDMEKIQQLHNQVRHSQRGKTEKPFLVAPLIGSWVLGAAVGAAAMFCFLRFMPTNESNSPIPWIDRSEPHVNSDRTAPQISANSEPVADGRPGAHDLESLLHLSSDAPLLAGSHLKSGKHISISIPNDSIQPIRSTVETNDASVGPSQLLPSTRKRLFQELLDNSMPNVY
ncbi:MAG: hypothetical protein ABL921_31995 [Pirellula sp.]